MAIYRFQFKSMIGAGAYGGNQTCKIMTQSNEQALGFALAIEPLLANQAKVGVMSEIKPVGDYELNSGSSDLTDVFTYRFVCESKEGRFSMYLPLKPDTSVNQVIQSITANLKSEDGTPVSVKSFSMTGQNVVPSGAVNPDGQKIV